MGIYTEIIERVIDGEWCSNSYLGALSEEGGERIVALLNNDGGNSGCIGATFILWDDDEVEQLTTKYFSEQMEPRLLLELVQELRFHQVIRDHESLAGAVFQVAGIIRTIYKQA